LFYTDFTTEDVELPPEQVAQMAKSVHLSLPKLLPDLPVAAAAITTVATF